MMMRQEIHIYVTDISDFLRSLSANPFLVIKEDLSLVCLRSETQ